MCFVRNRSSYSFETCTIVIGMPENLRVHGVWSSKYKGKWCFIPKCVLSETDHHTALKLVPLWLACLKTSGCMEFGPLNTKRSDVLSQNVFCQKQIIIQLWNLYHCDWHAWKPQGGPVNKKRSDVLSQNVFCQKQIWPCLNTKFGQSDVLSQNVFCQKQIIIQLWNLYHCDWHAWKPQGVHGVWPCKYVLSQNVFCQRSSYSWLYHLSQNVFCQKQIIIQLWNLYHCDWHAWKPQGAWSLVL